ncbi:hypothetical protein NECID01_1034 [Nematocida sp. AWRm77]|nr:hypothetical protein NECID01_1034 [Nematocida sp. AWRm77]
MSVHALVQYVVSCVREGKHARVADMQHALHLDRAKCVDALQLARDHFLEMGYALVPGSCARVSLEGEVLSPEKTTAEYTHVLASFAKCDFVYLAKDLACCAHEVLGINEYAAEIAYLAALIFLNGRDLEYTRAVWALEEVQRTEEVLKYGISHKYVKKYKKQESVWVRLGWKFFFEYPDFKPEKYLAAAGSLSAERPAVS